MTRASNTDERRAQIAAAMVRVVAREGYERSSVHEIAREAGIAPGLVHYHFRRKLDVLLAMQERVVERHLARIARSMERGETPSAKVRAFIDCHLARGAEEDPEALACWIALSAEALRDTEVRAGFNHAVRTLVGALEDAVREDLRTRELDTRPARSVATAIFAAIQGYYTLHGASPGLIPRGSAAPSVHALAASLLDWTDGADAPRRASPSTRKR